jgi:predicted MFS family arabinose efflux permease
MTSTEVKKNKYRWVIQGIWVLVILSQQYITFATAPLLTTIMEEYSLDYATGGLLMTIVAVLGGVSMFGGDATVRFLGIKRGVALALLLFVVGDLLSIIALSYFVLMIGRVLLGVGFGLLRTLEGAVTIVWFPSKEQPFINTFNSIIATLGQTAAFAITIPFLKMVGNWHTIYIYTGIAVSVVFVIWLILGKDSPVAVSTLPAADTEAPLPNKKKEHGLATAWKMKEVRLMTLASIGMFMAFTAVSTFFPSYLQEGRGFTAEAASLMTGSMPMAGMIGCLIVGSMSGIIGRRRPFMWPMMVLALAGMVAATVSNNTVLITLGICAVGFGISSYIPMMFTVLMELPGATPGVVASGIALTIGVAQISTLFDSWIYNALAPLIGLSGAMLFFAFLLVASLAFSLMLPETGPGRRKQ